MNNSSRNTPVDALRANALYTLLVSFVGVWLLWDAVFYRLVLFAPWADYWEHTALLTEWLNNFSDPANPHVNSADLSPRYMPWFWVLTYLGTLFGFDSVDLMSLSAVANYLLIGVGLHLFLKNYFRDHWAPVVGFIVIFFFWGVSWNWSNLYHLRSFFYVAGFPSTFVFGLSLLSFTLVLKLLRRDGSVLIMSALLCALSALMFLSHPLTGVFGIVGCGLLALTESAESITMRALTIVALAAGTVFAELWPYFSVWKLALGMYGSGMKQWFSGAEPMGPLERLRSGVWQHIFYNPRLILIMFGPTLLGLPLCLWLLAKREHRFIVFGAVVMAVPYLVHPLMEMPLAHRFILFVAFFFQLAIVWGVLEIIDAWNSRPRPLWARGALLSTLGVIGILIVFNVVLLAMEFTGRTLSPKTLTVIDKTNRLPDGLNVVELYAQLTKPLPDDAVVLTTPMDGWPLPTVKGKVVSLFHENPMLLDQQERYYRTGAFFELAQTDGDRAALIVKYSPTHLLLKGEPRHASLASWLPVHARQVAGVGEYRMYRLLPSAAEGATEVIVEEPAPAVVTPIEIEQPELSVPAETGNFGAPIAAPLIAEPDTDIDTPLPDEVVAPAAETPEPLAQPEESKSQVYGAPIAEPVLDPERHGGGD